MRDDHQPTALNDDQNDDDETRIVDCCPECGSSQFRHRVSTMQRPDMDRDRYRCTASGCQNTFNDPDRREDASGGGHDAALSGLAAKLNDADPDDVSRATAQGRNREEAE